MKTIFKKISAFFVLVLVLALYGGAELIDGDISLYPMLSRPEIEVWITHTGLGKKEFNTLWGRKIEQELSAIDGVDQTVSKTYNEKSYLKVRFVWNFDNDVAERSVRSVVARYQGAFPDHWREPWISPATVSRDGPKISVSSSKLKKEELSLYAENIVLPKITSHPSIEDVYFSSYHSENISIELDHIELLSRNITSLQIHKYLDKFRFKNFLGEVNIDSRQHKVVLDNTLKDIEGLEKSPTDSRR